MQQYIFRGLTANNKWVYGSLIQRTDGIGKLSLIEVQDKDGEITVHQVKDDSVGMWTGRFDKMQNKIFTGDIVGKGLGEIYFDDRHSQFRVRWHERVFKRVRGGDGEPLFANSEIAWEVIGDLTNNPELVNATAQEQL